MKPLIPYFESPVLHIPLPFEIFGATEIPIHGFGVLVAIGFLVGSQVAIRRADRVGLSGEAINRLVGWLVLGTFIGGHVGYGLLYAPEEYLADPRNFLYMWQGLSSVGGLVTCLALCIWFFRSEKLAVWPYLDNLAFGFAIGWFFGRMGCFAAHDHPGTETTFWLGVPGMCPGLGPEVACHDMGLYEALWSLAVFGIFLLLDRKPRVPGFYVLTYLLAYAPTRFLMDFLRPESTDARYAGLTPAQWAMIASALVTSTLLARRLRSDDAPVWTPPGTEPPATPEAREEEPRED